MSRDRLCSSGQWPSVRLPRQDDVARGSSSPASPGLWGFPEGRAGAPPSPRPSPRAFAPARCAATERTPSSRQCCGEHGRLPRRGVQSEPRLCPGGEVRHRRLAVIRGVAVPEGGVSVAALAARWSVLHGLPRKIWRRRHATIAPYWSTYGLADAGQGGLLCGDGCVEMFSRTRKRCLGRGTPGAIRETRRIRRASCGISVP